VAAAASASAPAQETVPLVEQAPADIGLIARVEAEIVAPRLTLPAGEPAPFQVGLRNPARVPVTVPEACLASGALTLARLNDGARPAARKRALRDGPLTVPPGVREALDFDLAKLYRRLPPGRYAIQWRCGEWMSPERLFVVAAPYDREKDRVAVLNTDLGALELVLMPEHAPEHVRSFVELARQGYYDGAAFTQIIPGVEAEVGDPWGGPQGGWANQMPPEINPVVSPVRGIVGARRRETSMTSATIFFLLLDTQPTYRGKQTFFAYVREGDQVLDALSAVPLGGGTGPGAFRPVKPVRIQKVEIREN
jgi:cyclophilin family peptidyl-prolyl cis-trans isomerase